MGTHSVTEWDLTKLPQGQLIENIFYAPGFFANLPPIAEAVEGLKQLDFLGHEIFVVTAHCTNHSAAEKIAWCRQHLPFIPKDRVVVTKAKHILRADAIIDDSPANCQAFKSENPGAIALTPIYPYNDSPVYDCMAPSYKHPRLAWELIIRYINRSQLKKIQGPPLGFDMLSKVYYRLRGHSSGGHP